MMGNDPTEPRVPAPHGTLRAVRHGFIIPWLSVTDGRVLRALGDAVVEDAVDIEAYVKAFAKYRQAAYEHAKQLKMRFEDAEEGKAMVALDKLYQKHGAILPFDGCLGPSIRCPVEECKNPKHPYCHVQVYLSMARDLGPDYDCLVKVALGLLTVAREIAPDAVTLCDMGWKAVRAEVREVTAREKSEGNPVRLPKHDEPTRVWADLVGGTPLDEWQPIKHARRHMKSLADSSDEQLEARFVQRVSSLRPRAEQRRLEETFRDALAWHHGPPHSPPHAPVKGEE